MNSSTLRGKIGHYELLENVGQGQFGTVWRALDTHLGRIVAIKIPRRETLDPHTRKMFQREAAAAAALDHPNIVGVYAVIDEGDQFFIVSEFINGDDLKLLLKADGFSSYADIVRFMIATAEAVHHAHERNIIHRDLKPGNIIVDCDRQPHLTDFGLAKIQSDDTTITVYGGQPVGTLSYMSPEQAAGEVHGLNRQSDIFSLGAVLYEMLTGQRAFPGIGLDILEKIRLTEPISPRKIKPDLPWELEIVCLKSLRKDPSDRYATALELAEDLRSCLEGRPTIARPITPVEVAGRWIRNNLVFAAVCAVAVFSTAAAALALWQSQPSTVVVELATSPSNAQLAFFPLDASTAEVQKDKVIRAGRSPVAVRLQPGDYLVVARLDDGRFHEVIRHVPRDSHVKPEIFPHRNWHVGQRGVQLPLVRIPQRDVTRGMADFQGNGITAPFKLDPHEVTIEEFRTVFEASNPGIVSPENSKSGQVPLTGTLVDYAIWYAELVGKRLPTDVEFEFAATNGGTTRYPWGDAERQIPLALSPVATLSFDRTATDPPVYGLASNGGEFTATPLVFTRQKIPRLNTIQSYPANEFVTVYGARDHAKQGEQIPSSAARFRSGIPRASARNDIGFRCSRSISPTW